MSKQTIAPLITRLEEAVAREVQQYYHELKSQVSLVSHFDDVDLVEFTGSHFSPVYSQN